MEGDDDYDEDGGDDDNTLSGPGTFIYMYGVPGAYLGFCQGGCTFLADLPHLPPPPPPGSGSGSGSASRFELDPDPAPDPQHSNADPQPWVQLSKDCCPIYIYV